MYTLNCTFNEMPGYRKENLHKLLSRVSITSALDFSKANIFGTLPRVRVYVSMYDVTL